MTFWGCQLKPGVPFKLEANGAREVLHLSQACLHSPGEKKTFVQVIDGKQKYAIVSLQKGKAEYASFDLFFRPGQCSFVCTGDSEVHLTGYFEPDVDDGDDDEEGEEEELLEESESEDEAPPPAKKKKTGK
eukprot:TRINITY_DN124848_c0_g1_i1.p1 TRINITY_DN124848_c0_g1~~TRINITY_DN124848_c0_g1_i1.p1  ORF type:complete len:131 (-),score=54.03 TRINITY_DN124848_c0_g1_i1:79-471(-)